MAGRWKGITFWPVELKQEAQRATYCAPEYNVPLFWRIGQGGHLAFLISQTRGPKGQCRSPMSPEYNKRVKNLTSEWNQNQQPICFKIIAMHSVCCCSLQGWKTRFTGIRWPGEPPPPDLFLPCPWSAPGQIWSKQLNAYAGPWALHPYKVS